ncbi:MAG: hypothetical protein M3277_04440 [Actinomycetota bacterium]|nr:hypothetical protein [Actinomycetota bacterium]
MNDFERALSDALKKTSDDYRPTDQHAAKERFLHRLRRRQLFFAIGGVGLAGAAAVLAGFLVFARDTTPAERAEPLPPAAQLTEEVPDIAVGERPSGVAYGDDSVWVANSGDGTVMVIDPNSREVTNTITVGGDPDDVAVGVGAAWVSDSGAGTITRVPLPSSDEPLEPVAFPVGEPGSTHMDVAPGADGLWVAKDDSVFRVDPDTNDVQPVAPTVESPTDIAVGEGAVYVLGESEVVRVDPASLDATHLADVVPSANQDMGFKDGFLWIANGDAGEVTRVDPITGDRSAPIFVGGNFSGISVDEDAVWVISGGASDVGVLTRIDPDTLAVQGGRAELDGRPYDITTGAGLVWIANQSAGTVSGLHPDALPDGPDGPPAGPADIVFAFSADGDIWGETFSRDLVPLVDGPGLDRHPTISPDGTRVAFQRTSDTGAGPEVYVRDLSSGEETFMGEGVSPSFGPDGRLAWFKPTSERGAFDYDIAVARLGGEPLTFDATVDWRDPQKYPASQVGNLTWDLAGNFLYYNQIGGGTSLHGGLLYQLDAVGEEEPFALVPQNHRGLEYHAPSVRSESTIHVLGVCCAERGGRGGLELGMISFGEGGALYEPLVELDQARFDIYGREGDLAANKGIFEAATLDSAGNLALDGQGNERRWRHTVIRSWFIATSRGIWLVNAEGRVTDVADAIGGLRGIAGLETAPEFDD